MILFKNEKNLVPLANTVFNLFTDKVGGDPLVMSGALHVRFNLEYDYVSHGKNILDYFKNVVIPHKLAVYEAGMAMCGQEWIKKVFSHDDLASFKNNLWFHDLSKFSSNESLGYAEYNRETGEGKMQFELAWHHHKMNNPHHPEYWLNPNRSGQLEKVSMPDIYILEMIADWIGAGKTYGSTLQEWLPQNIFKFVFNNPNRVAELLNYQLTDMTIAVLSGGSLTIK